MLDARPNAGSEPAKVPTAEPNTSCRICGSKGDRQSFTAQERQFGIGHRFTYFECSACGSANIDQVPSNLADYYPPHYYSFERDADGPAEAVGFFRRFLRSQRAHYSIDRKGSLGALISRMGSDYFPYPWQWFRAAGVTTKSAILDVGCGGGALLRAMRDQGFTRLAGVDPFIADSFSEPFLAITKGEIFDLQGCFDLVMFHHSLEHVPDPSRSLVAAASLCAPGGAVLVRIPVAGGAGWREYGEHWFPLDAPRHLAIPSPRAMRALGERCGLKFQQMEFDTKGYCYEYSERYRRGLPMTPAEGTQSTPDDMLFTADQISRFEDRARVSNAAGDGDLACFVFRKPPPAP